MAVGLKVQRLNPARRSGPPGRRLTFDLKGAGSNTSDLRFRRRPSLLSHKTISPLVSACAKNVVTNPFVEERRTSGPDSNPQANDRVVVNAEHAFYKRTDEPSKRCRLPRGREGPDETAPLQSPRRWESASSPPGGRCLEHVAGDTLSMLLKMAVKWKVMGAMPCSIELLKVSQRLPRFYEFGQYAALVEAAGKIDTSTLLVVLLGGDAGLRRGEMIGLRWCDVDLRRKQLLIEQSIWKGIADAPKSGHGRIIPMTDALASALQRHRHLRGERVLCVEDGTPATDKILRRWVTAAKRRAQLPVKPGALHILRHTFCSHLAMRGAPAKAIQELAGHENLMTTLRYMHLSPAARTSAIGLLNGRQGADDSVGFGDMVETGARRP